MEYRAEEQRCDYGVEGRKIARHRRAAHLGMMLLARVRGKKKEEDKSQGRGKTGKERKEDRVER